MAQSYKKGRKFKTESPALLSITRGGRPAAAPPPPPPPLRPFAPPPRWGRIHATIHASVPPSASALRASACIPTSVLPSASVLRTPPAHLSVPSSVAALCAVARTPLCASASIPTSVLPSASVSRTSAPIPASVPPSAFRLWIVVGVRFLRRGKRGRTVPDKIGVVEILLKNRAPRGWNPANNS